MARERQPDLITMDLMLPDLDGFEAIRLLREQRRDARNPGGGALRDGARDRTITRALGATVLPDQAVQLGLDLLRRSARACLRLDRSLAP